MTSQQMSLTEARELLDLAAPAEDAPEGAIPDALTLRKAYVRAIKRYSPESNPLEFQRVRSAYEFLEERRRWGDYDPDDDDIADVSPTRGHDEPVPGEAPTDEILDRDQPPAPTGGSVEAALPPWHATQDELTAILTSAGVMQDGVRPHSPIPDVARERLLFLLWWGWPEPLDQPLVRFTARLFELGHTYEGHVLLERLLSASERPLTARGAFSDVFRARLVGIAQEVRIGGDIVRIDWVYAGDQLESDRASGADGGARRAAMDAVAISMSPRTKQLVTFLACALVSAVLGTVDWRPSGASNVRLNLSSWVEDTCRRYPTACDDASDVAEVLEGGHCSRIVPELASFGAVLAQKLTIVDARAVVRRARKEARQLCPDDLAREPDVAGGSPP